MSLTENAKFDVPASQLEPEASVKVILAGKVVGLPTETVWGMACRWDDPKAVDEVYRRKGREPGKPLQLLCASVDAALAFVSPEDQAAARALSAVWPGPLTLVVRSRNLPAYMAPGGLVGLRVPQDAATQAVLAALPGQAAAATSLNPAGERPASTFEDARAYLGGLIDHLHPGGTAAGLASSVYLAAEHRLSREGAIPLARVEDLLRQAGLA
ncbi:MAG TPA: L-threonylcarbamoyladenylate synthase [Deinococcales bacterium]|nr:L-threonylcarbamoyladenylate synthase [Deinococcales bacterium]